MCPKRTCRPVKSFITLSPTRWHGKHTYLSSLGILGKKRNYFPEKITVTLNFKLKCQVNKMPSGAIYSAMSNLHVTHAPLIY